MVCACRWRGGTKGCWEGVVEAVKQRSICSVPFSHRMIAHCLLLKESRPLSYCLQIYGAAYNWPTKISLQAVDRCPQLHNVYLQTMQPGGCLHVDRDPRQEVSMSCFECARRCKRQFTEQQRDLPSFAVHECEYPRDKVYGLLGIV